MGPISVLSTDIKPFFYINNTVMFMAILILLTAPFPAVQISPLGLAAIPEVALPTMVMDPLEVVTILPFAYRKIESPDLLKHLSISSCIDVYLTLVF